MDIRIEETEYKGRLVAFEGKTELGEMKQMRVNC